MINSGPISIHPGVVNNRRVHALETSTKPHKGGGKLGKKMKALAARRLDHSATLSRNSSAPAGTYKAPGSMNQHK